MIHNYLLLHEKQEGLTHRPILFSIPSYLTYICRSINEAQFTSGMLWSAGLQGFWSDWYPPLWFINWDKTCSTLNSLTSTLLSNSSSCFFVILIFTSVVLVVVVAATMLLVLAKLAPSPFWKPHSSMSMSSVLNLVDDFKQFPIERGRGGKENWIKFFFGWWVESVLFCTLGEEKELGDI